MNASQDTPVAWRRQEFGLWVYYETKAWDDLEPLYTAPPPPVGAPQGVSDEENEKFSRDVSNFKGSDPEATKYALEQFAASRSALATPSPAQAEPRMVSAGHQYRFTSPFGGDVWRDDSSEWNGNRPKASREIFALATGAAEGAEPTADAERLDWLELQDLNDLAFGYVIDAPQDGSIFIHAGDKPHYAKTLRAAIDAARAAQKGQP